LGNIWYNKKEQMSKILIILISIVIIGTGFAVWYNQIPRCPESCDDGNLCTEDFCSSETNYQCTHSSIVEPVEGCKDLIETCKQYQCVEGECQIVILADCCGNEKCEAGEDWEICPQDCEWCNDGNPCTEDIYSYKTDKCSYVNLDEKQLGCSAEVTCGSQVCRAGICRIEYISNCCGNGICETGEIYKECADDCVKTGHYRESEVWGGEILITGDVYMEKNLKILPGTVVKFAVQDDKHEGREIPADGFNDLDPTRLVSYGKTHSSLTVGGKLTAVGTPENRILFTSAAGNPKIADWEVISPHGDGSLIEYATIEWSRGGISLGDEPTPNSIFRNNIIRYTMWGSISTGWSGCQVYNNEIYECGHEGIDVQGRNPIIENNTIYDCHVGIVILRGSAIVRNNLMKNIGNGIHIGGDAAPILENNHIEIAPHDSKKEWCYEDFCYPMFGEPVDTPILTEVYKENNLPRYAVSAYRIENKDHRANLPLEAEEWLAYGWKNDKWNKINVRITATKCEFPFGYSMYVLIPNPTQEEKDAEIFNDEHYDIYKIMAV